MVYRKKESLKVYGGSETVVGVTSTEVRKGDHESLQENQFSNTNCQSLWI